jgi:hypothetical protein
MVQEEPGDSLDPVRLGLYASIGIQKGKPFAPDARMKKTLTEAAAVGDATARAIAFRMRQKADFYYEKSAWRLPFLGGYRFEEQPGVLNLDGYIIYYFAATGVTPAMEEKMAGQGSQYAWAVEDADHTPLDGGKTYGFTSLRTSRSRTSAPSSSTATRPAPWCRPISSSRQ